jgi:hypothetical protein|tara:strand:- start:245 stop:589 length:345 start_codon:yes stop_codon:yes gene_type:complete
MEKKMKKILFTICLLLVVSSNVVAKEENAVYYKAMNPCDVIKGFGYYLKDVGCRVGYGAETIITAPFKAEVYFPEPTYFKYTPPTLDFDYTPPGWERLGKPKQEGSVRFLFFKY